MRHIIYMLRGGSWYYFERDVRAAYRFHNEPSNADDSIGFRLIRGSGK